MFGILILRNLGSQIIIKVSKNGLFYKPVSFTKLVVR